MAPASKGLTAHYFFTFGVEVQLVGDRKNTRVDQRILHLDVAAAALKLVQKGSVVVFLRFDSINQIVFDDAEPRSILISCRDDRRYFIVFQSIEDNLVFRTACADLAAKSLDLERFQRSVLRKGQLLKRGKAGALFGDRYAILTPRKLFVLTSKVSVFPSNAISLQEVSPRFDDAKGTIHLDVCGKEYVFQGTDKDSSQEWFVDVARAATSKVPILAWVDTDVTRAQQEGADVAAADSLSGDGEGDWEEDQEGQEEYVEEGEELLSLTGTRTGRTRQSRGPTHFTEPMDWEEAEEPDDHHTEQLHSHGHTQNHNRQGPGSHPNGPQHRSQGGSRGAGQGRGNPRQQQQQQQRGPGSRQASGDDIGGGRGSAAGGRGPASLSRSAPGSTGGGNSSMSGAGARNTRTVTRSWSGSSNNSAANRLQPQQRGLLSLAPAPGHQVFRSSSSNGSGSGGRGGSNVSRRSGSGNVAAPLSPQAAFVEGTTSLTGSTLDTIYEAGESEGVEGTSSDPSHHASGTEGYTTGEDTAAEGMDNEQQWHHEEQQMMLDQQQFEGLGAEAEDEFFEQQQQQQQQQKPRQFAPPPAAPPLRLSKLKALPQQLQHLGANNAAQQQQQEAVPARRSVGPGAIAAAAAAAASKRAAMQQQQQQQVAAAAAAAAAAAMVQQQQQQDAADGLAGASDIAGAAAATASATGQQQQMQHSFASTGGFLSPKTQIDLSAVTEAVAARLLTHQQQQQQARQQQQQHVAFADTLQQQQQRGGFQGSPMALGPTTPPSAAASALFGSPYATNSSAAAASGNTWGSNNTISYGSGSGGLGSSGGYASGLNPASRPDSTEGWGRKSLAGLYSSSTGPRAQGSGPSVAFATAGDADGQYVGDYSGLQGAGWGAEGPAAAAQNPRPSAAAALQAALPAAVQAVQRASAISPATAPAAGIQGYGTMDAGYGTAVASTARRGSSSSSDSSSQSSRGGVVSAEYIIPSVMRVVVSCPEAHGLVVQLNAQAQLTPHQRCLALLRWAFGVYRQLPREARTAIPSGPRRKQVKAWTSPDMTSLTRNIRTTQLAQQQKQRQQDLADQQAVQQELALQQQQQLQETVLKQQQQLDQLIQLMAQPAGSGDLGLGLGLSVNPRASLSPQTGQLLGADGEVDGGGLGSAAAKLMPLSADSPYSWAAYTRGFNAASEALAGAAAAAADASSSPTHLQQLIMQRQQQIRQQQGVPPQLLQVLTSAASASGAQTATAVAAAAAAAAAASKLPASSIALLLQEAASNMLAQQQQQCCQGYCSCCSQQQYSKADSHRHKAHSSRNNLAAEPSGCCDAAAGSSAAPQRGLYRSSTGSSMNSSSNADPAGAEQGAVLDPVSVDLPPMSLSVRLKGLDGDSGAAGQRVSAVLDSKQQQQMLGAGLKPLGTHRLKGRCSFTVDNPLFQLEVNQAGAGAAAAGSAAMGGLVSGSSGSSFGSSRRCSALYLSPAAAETICQAAAAAASAAASAVRSAVLTLDGEDLLAASDTNGVRPHSIQSLVGEVERGDMQPGDFVATVAAGRAGPLLRPGRGSSSSS